MLVLLPLADILAGVLVAPPVVFISEKGRTGRLTVQNPTNAPKEVTIDFAFGIPESDSLGNVSIDLQDSAVTDPRSAMGWVKAFPRKLIIPANGSQIVRFVADPPKDLADGEYWARVVVQAQEGTTTIPTPEDDNKITTKLNMIMRTAIMLKYRKGDCVANVELTNSETQVTDSNVYAVVDLVNRGNVSYVGLLSCRLLDADGKEISKSEIHLAVYHDLRRRVELPIVAGDFKRPFTVEVNVTNKGRKDLPQEEMIFGNDILFTMNVEE
ncbi:MAG: hypothetical protein AB1483_09810 [Candidatus Zixiibacteriota bacterium]